MSFFVQSRKGSNFMSIKTKIHFSTQAKDTNFVSMNRPLITKPSTQRLKDDYKVQK